MKKLCYFFCLFFFLLAWTAQAQGPQVSQVYPANLAIVEQGDLEIVIDFDQPLDLSAVDVSTFKVFGRWTGPRTGLGFSLSNDNKTVRLLLDTDNDPFNAGEWVSVSINTLLKGANGEQMALGYAWNFWIATSQGSLRQTKIKTIDLRQPGEGLLQTYGAYAGDLDNDTYSDLVAVNETSDDLRVMLNDQQGDYSAGAMAIINMGQATPSPNEGADFNFDGDIDLAVCTAHDNELRVLMGDGEGGFFSQDDYTTGANARGLVVMDYNGDGAEDIIIANRGSSNLTLFANDGTGVFEKMTIDPDPLGLGESGLAAVDANNDGLMDLFLGNYESQEIALLLGDGKGGFTLIDKIKLTGEDRPWMIAVADFNHDGFADVASANSNGNTLTIHFAEGDLGFLPEPQTLIHPRGIFPLAIDVGDIDGDNDLDIVTSNYTSVSYLIFENDGFGDFSVADELSATKNASCAILHDRDNDGDLDISATDEGDDRIFLFENVLLNNSLEDIAELFNSIRLSPNPFEDQLQIDFYLRERAKVNLNVFDVTGRKVATVWDGKLTGGKHRLFWDGKNEADVKVNGKVYFLEMQVGERVLTKLVFKKE